MVWGSTIGAVVGPNLVAPAGTLAVSLGLPELAGAFVITAIFIGLAYCLAFVLLRPEPYALADPSALAMRAEVGPAPSVATLLRRPALAVALISLVAGQVVMVLIMTMTPIHLIQHGHGLATVGLVLSAHTFGMFALSPISGRLTDRFGDRARGDPAAAPPLGGGTARAVARRHRHRCSASPAHVAAAVVGARLGAARSRRLAGCVQNQSAVVNAGDIVVRATGIESGQWPMLSLLPALWALASLALLSTLALQAMRLNRLTSRGVAAHPRHAAIATRFRITGTANTSSDVQRAHQRPAGVGVQARARAPSSRLARLA